MEEESKKLTTGRIEEVLLKKKQNEAIKEIRAAAESFANTMNQYTPREETDRKIFLEWVRGFIAPNHWQVFIDTMRIERLPKGVSTKILEDAVTEFLQTIQSTKEIVDSLEL